MPLELGDFSRLLGLLYEGLAFPERWEDFLAEVARQMGCDKAAIIFHDQNNQSPAMGFFTGRAEEAMRDYNAHYGARNPVAQPILRELIQTGSWYGLVRSVVNDVRTRRASIMTAGGGRTACITRSSEAQRATSRP